jgi:ABC-2 type transport system permease protein
MANSLRNIMAIGGKELRSYFASPIAWIILGLFAFIFGYFYVAYLNAFLNEAMQAQFGGGPSSVNVNQFMIRGLFNNVSVILLFLAPMMTMRTYAEEKRGGTMELLLTAPLQDVEIILGKFIGAMGLYCAMLAVTVFYIGLLFVYGNPEWKPLVSGYLGLLLMGGCFVAIGLFMSSLTKNQIVAGVGTFVILLLLWVVNWLADSSGPTMGAVLSYLSITQHFDDFGKGVIDTKHLVYYASVITFGLFLTAKSVDSERWRG